MVGRSRSRSTEKDYDVDDQQSMEPNDGTSEPTNKSSSNGNKKSTFPLRWKKFSGGNNNKEWANGCGGGMMSSPGDDDAGSDELDDGPPILTIEVDQSKEIDLSHRVRQKTEAQMSKEFALAARRAVQNQMNILREELDCSNREDCGDEMDGSARSQPPPDMAPTSLLEAFGSAKIQEIVISDDADPALGEKVQARDLVFRHSGASGCLVFVIRRPGCLLCREQALYLKFLFQNYPQEVEGFTIVGVVKEFCDKSGGEKLQEFHDKYFPFPLYLDIDKAAYKALGNRKTGLGAAFKVLNPFSDTAKRIKRNQINGNMLGEGFLKGGIIIYHKHGIAAYKYEEETGHELPVANIVKGLRSVRRDDFVAPTPETRKSEGANSHRHHNQLDMSVRTVA
mmetsp:Transcript_28971/g.69958  ORF Transcript_28971/g.69958 Transcript_28971/m.69958 type:complete len:395 (-) Transcript_28971:415-1599(-)